MTRVVHPDGPGQPPIINIQQPAFAHTKIPARRARDFLKIEDWHAGLSAFIITTATGLCHAHWPRRVLRQADPYYGAII